MLRRLAVVVALCSGCTKDPSSPADAGGDAQTDGGPHVVRFRRVQLTSEFFAEGAAYGDFDRDGINDVVSGPYWYVGPGFTTRHALFPPVAFDIKAYSDSFFVFVHDFDRDGWSDVLNVGFPGDPATWLQNPKQSGAAWTRHPVLSAVDGESPQWVDLTGDGGMKLLTAHQGQLGFAVPDPANPYAAWSFVPASAPGPFFRFTHGLGLGDVNGDGRRDLLEARGVWLQPADPAALWTFEPHDFGAGGAQMFATDVDGDGDADVIISLSAHGYGHAWYERRADGGFLAHPITSTDPDAGLAIHEPHALDLADFNGDGLPDLVAGERFWGHVPAGTPDPSAPAPLYWFELRRDAGSTWFVPHPIAETGVGTQVVAGDVNRDGRSDLVVASKKGAYVFLQEP